MMKHLEIWSSLYNNVKDIWVIILITGVFSFIKFLIQSDIYNANNILKIKAVFKHVMKYADVAFIAFIYLLIMIAFSLISYPTNEVSKYISSWDNIGSFAIMLILYALLFPIIILLFLKKVRGKPIL